MKVIKKLNPLVFIVEDNDAYRILLGRILEKRGFDTMMFEHGLQALEILETCKPQLILSDIQMPFMDGIELCESVRAKYPNLGIPFLYISSTTCDKLIEQAVSLSTNEMLGKPIKPELLVNSINAAIAV